MPASSDAPGEADLVAWSRLPWIVNSRNTADEEAVRTLGTLGRASPRGSAHPSTASTSSRTSSSPGTGSGCCPLERPTAAGVRVLPLPAPGVQMTAYAMTRRVGRHWPPLRVVLDQVARRMSETTNMSKYVRNVWINL